VTSQTGLEGLLIDEKITLSVSRAKARQALKGKSVL